MAKAKVGTDAKYFVLWDENDGNVAGISYSTEKEAIEDAESLVSEEGNDANTVYYIAKLVAITKNVAKTETVK